MHGQMYKSSTCKILDRLELYFRKLQECFDFPIHMKIVWFFYELSSEVLHNHSSHVQTLKRENIFCGFKLENLFFLKIWLFLSTLFLCFSFDKFNSKLSISDIVAP